jgi:integrase
VELPRQQVSDGINPIKARKDDLKKKKQDAAKQVPFDIFAERWAGLQGWKPKTAKNRHRQIQKHLNPVLGKILMGSINDDDVDSALASVWGTNTGEAMQNCLERILNSAIAKKLRSDNPARWKIVQERLGRYRRRVKHLEDVPFEVAPWFVAKLRAHRNKQTENRPLSTYSLEFLLLTAVRKGQALKLRWDQIDPVKRIFVCGPDEHKTSETDDDGDPIFSCIIIATSWPPSSCSPSPVRCIWLVACEPTYCA